MTQYTRGTAFERAIAKRFVDDGYFVVRAAGSHGVADLVALKPTQVVLVQCKLGGPGELTRTEWNTFLEAARRVRAAPVVASRPVRGKYAYHLLNGPRDSRTRVDSVCAAWHLDEVAP